MTVAIIAFGLLAISSADPAVSPSPAKTDDEVWALAGKSRVAEAYRVYLRRFPAGRHAAAAKAAICGPGGCLEVPTVAVPPVIAPVPMLPSAIEPDACGVLLSNHELNKVESAEASHFLAASRANRLADLRAFVLHYPGSACRRRAESIIRIREARRLNYKPIKGFGPLAPHRLGFNIFSPDDYPMSALRDGVSGKVIAEYDVADDGIVEACRIVQSSGSTVLDATTCRIITRRSRYDPARDAAGMPVRSTDRMTATWIVPPEEAPGPSPLGSKR